MTTDTTLDLEDVISDCQELIEEHAQPALDALRCAETVENLTDAEANVADALSEARALVAKREAMMRAFRVAT